PHQRGAPIGERERHPAPSTKRPAHVDNGHSRAECSVFRERRHQRPVAVAVGKKTRPDRMVEERRVSPALHELEPPPIAKFNEPHDRKQLPEGAPVATGGAGRAATVRRSRIRRSQARCRADGISTTAGSGSSAARIANSIGPRSAGRYQPNRRPPAPTLPN